MNINTIAKFITDHLPKRDQILQIILLCIWVLFQYWQGNRLYAIFLVLIFAVLSIFQLKDFTLIAASVLVIVLFKTPTLETWLLIRDSNLRTFQSFKPSVSRLFKPISGRDLLPNDIQQMVSLLEGNKITSYRIPNSFTFETNMRITEAAWPIRQEETSPYLLYRLSEVVDLTGCTEVDRRKDVALGYCP